MLAHWKAWLENHPTRSAEWLKAMIKQGFEVHHLVPEDGDEPTNLVLIEAQDHRMGHGGGLNVRSPQQAEPFPETLEIGERGYNLRLQGRSWESIKDALGVKWSTANHAVVAYAKATGKPWPLTRGRSCHDGKCPSHR